MSHCQIGEKLHFRPLPKLFIMQIIIPWYYQKSIGHYVLGTRLLLALLQRLTRTFQYINSLPAQRYNCIGRAKRVGDKTYKNSIEEFL